MRWLVRNIILYSVALFIIQLLFAGVLVQGGFVTYLIAGIILTVLYFTLKPILQLLAFPINLATLGLFTILINTFILYIMTVFLPNVAITGFVFSGTSFLGFVVPEIAFNTFFAYAVCALVISCITTGVNWLFTS